VELAKVDNSSEKKGSSSAAIVIVVILIIIVAGIVAFIWYRKSKNQDNVDF
jgi:flagellar basal body-associated protein FliL